MLKNAPALKVLFRSKASATSVEHMIKMIANRRARHRVNPKLLNFETRARQQEQRLWWNKRRAIFEENGPCEAPIVRGFTGISVASSTAPVCDGTWPRSATSVVREDMTRPFIRRHQPPIGYGLFPSEQ